MDDKEKLGQDPEETNGQGTLPEEPENALTREEEIETEWANALHLDYDPEEARIRAEQAKAATPPPAPRQDPPAITEWPPRQQAPAPQPPQAPAQAPQPFGMQPAPYGHQEPMPQTYLVWSVLATVFCCLIPGIVAIVYSTMVSSRYYAKNYDGARRASDMAQYWIIASIVLGVITAAVYVPLSLFS